MFTLRTVQFLLEEHHTLHFDRNSKKVHPPFSLPICHQHIVSLDLLHHLFSNHFCDFTKFNLHQLSINCVFEKFLIHTKKKFKYYLTILLKLLKLLNTMQSFLRFGLLAIVATLLLFCLTFTNAQVSSAYNGAYGYQGGAGQNYGVAGGNYNSYAQNTQAYSNQVSAVNYQPYSAYGANYVGPTAYGSNYGANYYMPFYGGLGYGYGAAMPFYGGYAAAMPFYGGYGGYRWC